MFARCLHLFVFLYYYFFSFLLFFSYLWWIKLYIIKWLGEVTRVELGWVRSHIKHHPQPYGELKKVEKTTVDERVFIEVKICVLALDIHNTDTRQRTVSFPRSVHLSYVLIHVLALYSDNTDTRQRIVSFLQFVHLSYVLIHVLTLDIHNTDTRQHIVSFLQQHRYQATYCFISSVVSFLQSIHLSHVLTLSLLL